MIKKISKIEEFKAKSKVEKNISSLNEEHHIIAISEMNEKLALERREYQIKESNSQITASKVVLNA